MDTWISYLLVVGKPSKRFCIQQVSCHKSQKKIGRATGIKTEEYGDVLHIIHNMMVINYYNESKEKGKWLQGSESGNFRFGTTEGGKMNSWVSSPGPGKDQPP